MMIDDYINNVLYGFNLLRKFFNRAVSYQSNLIVLPHIKNFLSFNGRVRVITNIAGYALNDQCSIITGPALSQVVLRGVDPTGGVPATAARHCKYHATSNIFS